MPAPQPYKFYEMFSMYSLGDILAICVCCGVAYIFGIGIYNVYIHPFRNIPGSKLYAASRLLWSRDWLSGNMHRTVAQMHEQYGEVVRVSPDELSFINPEAWRDIYGSPAKGSKALIRDPNWYIGLTDGQPDLLNANESDHARFRKLLSLGFSEKSLREEEDSIHEIIALLLTRLRERMEACGSVDMVMWYNMTTFDIIGNVVYGESFQCLEKSEPHPWLKLILQNLKLYASLILVNRHLVSLRLMTRFLTKDMTEMKNIHLAVIREKYESRAALKRDNKDVISTLEGKSMMTVAETEANLNVLTFAGTETSATCLSAATYYLSKNKAAAETLQAEILGSFKNEEEIRWESVKSLPYLNAVIKEALRLYPPAPLGLPRRAVEDGVVVCGYSVPKNTAVYITQYGAYRSSLNFTKPTEFRPERWLGDKEYESDRRAVFEPFLTGPRNCIGKTLAYMEINLILARMVWNFEWELKDPDSAYEDQIVYITWQKSPLNFRLRSREVPMTNGSGEEK